MTGKTFRDLVTERESRKFLRTQYYKQILPTKKFFEATQICCACGSNCTFYLRLEPAIQVLVQLIWLREKTAALSIASRAVC